jgi:hypoxanthine phosphoribosyltransferase
MPSTAPKALLSEEQIGRRVAELARQISADYAEQDEVLMVGVLRGAFIFLADLSRQLTTPRRVDFIAVSSYEDGDQPAGAVRLIMDLRSDIRGKHVLIVEDIVDTGWTLDYLMKNLAARHPASLKSCVLVRKPTRQEVAVHIDYLGFEIPDVWVVGYGLDFADRERTLPYIGVFEDDLEGA